MKINIFTAAALGIVCHAGLCAPVVSTLFARGYTVLPEPQEVSLGQADYTLSSDWKLNISAGVQPSDSAVRALREDLEKRYHLQLALGSGEHTITLLIEPGSVPVGKAVDGDKAALTEQAYEITLHADSVQIKANAETGLFYGAETFVQLLRREDGSLLFPEGKIHDWPDLQARHIYWDDAHHLENVDELKRVLRQAAFYKINGVALKLEGHFQFASAPAIVEPYALSPSELQELTDYGLRYHVQLIPYLDGPAHIAFILKHPEYAKLREFPDSNYELCATNPDSYKLLQGMFQDLMDANKGVDTFYLSTDEPYYLGLAKNAQCNEKDAATKGGSPGQLFATFVKSTADYLHDHGRKVVFWGEYPMKPEDIPAFPSYLINGEVYGSSFDSGFRAHGIRQMIYTSTEGEEKLFPLYDILPPSRRLHPDYSSIPRVEDIFNKISYDASRQTATLIGSVDAGWADEGVHPETFWLGYIASGAVAWHPASPNLQEMASSFYSLFYGPEVSDMSRVYRLMSMQAQTWNDTWDTVKSTSRKPIWGSSYEIYNPRRPAQDQSLPLPPAPTESLMYRSNWSAENAKRLSVAAQAMVDNETVSGLLHEDILKATDNRYNLMIFVTIAELCRQNLQMIDAIHSMDDGLNSAARLRQSKPKAALAMVDQAIALADGILQQRNRAYHDVQTVWEQRWYPRVEHANGRAYLHELDDVKDHLPDRTTDLSYVVYRESILPFGDWVNKILSARNAYAEAHHLPVRNRSFNWKSFEVVSPNCASATDVLSNPELRPADIDQGATCGLTQ